MKKTIIPIIAILLVLAGTAWWMLAPSPLIGNWQGTLNTGPARLRILFKITGTAWGGLTAKMDSPDQGARDLVMDKVVARGGGVKMELSKIFGRYEGILDKSKNKITGRWEQGPMKLQLNLTRIQGTEVAAEPESLDPEDQAASQKAAQKIEGEWNGVLTAGPSNLRLRVKISKRADGTATGTMDSLDQGARDIPLSAVTLREGTLGFEVRGVGGTYEGTLAPDGNLLTGQWTQLGQTFSLDFKKGPAEL